MACFVIYVCTFLVVNSFINWRDINENFSKYVHVYNIILPKMLELIEVINTTLIAK